MEVKWNHTPIIYKLKESLWFRKEVWYNIQTKFYIPTTLFTCVFVLSLLP